MSRLVVLPWSLLYLIRVSLALEIGFPNTPQSAIGHLSMTEIVIVLRRFVVPNSANVLIGESILTLKKTAHFSFKSTSLQNH